MRNINENEWIVITEIIYKMNSLEDIMEMRETFLKLIKQLIPYSSAIFYLSDPKEEHLLSNPVIMNYNRQLAKSYIEFGEGMDYTLGMMSCAKSMVFRDSDLMPEDSRQESDFYNRYLKSQGMHFVMQATFAYDDKFLGIVSLLRAKKQEDFSEKEIFIMNILKDHMSLRLFKETQKNAAGSAVRNKNVDLPYYTKAFELTRRESDVFELMARGMENQEICTELCITGYTLKKHILNIYRKLGVNSRLQFFKMIDLCENEAAVKNS